MMMLRIQTTQMLRFAQRRLIDDFLFDIYFLAENNKNGSTPVIFVIEKECWIIRTACGSQNQTKKHQHLSN